MMMTLLILKSRIKNLYEKHYHILRGILKTLIMFGILVIITEQLNYNDFFGQYFVLAALAVLCGITPDVVSTVITVLVAATEIASVSLLMSAVILVVLIIYLLLFGRLEKRQCEIILLIPLLSAIHIGYTVPVVAALFLSPVMIPAIIMGVVMQYFVAGVMNYSTAGAASVPEGNAWNALQYLSDSVLQNKMLLVTVIAYCFGFLCIYFIRRGKIRHGSQIGILVGAIVIMAIELLSNILWDLNLNLIFLTLQVVLSMAIAYVVQFFRLTLDYRGTRKLQFEDDEYYYYVTAIPKFKVAVIDKTVTRIAPKEEDSFDLKEELEKVLEEEAKEKKAEFRE